jgi:hypothetical protein
MRIDVDTVELPTAPEGHDPAECDCPHCLMVDMFRHLESIGVDPRPHAWFTVPTDWGDGVKRQRVVFSMPAMPKKRNRNGRGRSGSWGSDSDSPLAGIAVNELPAPRVPERERVPIRVEDIGAGAWVLATGTDRDGAAVVVSGAVIGGPDDTGRGTYAVEIRDPRAGADRVVYVPAGGTVFLVDDPAEHEARAAHALSPVYGDGADQVHLYRRETKADGVPRQTDRRRRETHQDVPAEQLGLWESGGAFVHLNAVHHTHRPVSEGAQ